MTIKSALLKVWAITVTIALSTLIYYCIQISKSSTKTYGIYAIITILNLIITWAMANEVK